MSRAVKTLKRAFGTIIKPGRFPDLHAAVYNSGRSLKEGQSIFVKKEGAPIEVLDLHSYDKVEDQIASYLGSVKRDIPATLEQALAINAILHKLAKTVGINEKQGLIENEFTQNIKSQIGFDPLDRKRRQDIFDEYQKAGLLPYQLNCADSQQLVEKLNLSSLFEEHAVNYKQKLDRFLEKEVPKAEGVRKAELAFSFDKGEQMVR